MSDTTSTDIGAAIVAALQERAGELSELAEEQMRPSLEERAQEWHEAAGVARRTAAAKVDAVREETRREILGDDLNPSALVLDAQAYRRLRETITSTMDDPDRWDRDADEESILSEYVRWLTDGKPARDDGWDDGQPKADRVLTATERAMLRYALDLAEDRIASEGDEFTDADKDAVASLKRLANGPVVAYRNPWQPGVLLCREHGDGWAGLTPLPDGGACTYSNLADPGDMCSRDVLAPQGGGPTAPDYRLAASLALGLGIGAPWDVIRERVRELHAAANGSQFPSRPCHKVALNRKVHPAHVYRFQRAESYWCPGMTEDES